MGATVQAMFALGAPGLHSNDQGVLVAGVKPTTSVTVG